MKLALYDLGLRVCAVRKFWPRPSLMSRQRPLKTSSLDSLLDN